MTKSVQVKILELDVEVFGNKSRIHPVLIWDEAEATLIDSGYPGIFEQLRQAVEQAGVSFQQVKRVLITHHDWDHIGTLPDILQFNGSVQIHAHAAEKPYIEGDIPPVKLTPERIAARIAMLPENMRAVAAATFASLPKAPVSRLVADNELLPVHGGIRVIHTPGHSPGHICLYICDCRLLVTGDQLRVDNGKLIGPAPEYTPDLPAALASLGKLLRYDINNVVCYHGGLYEGDIAARIARITEEI
ncbi:MBL fold metallo-hydrolase [Sporomusa aerivorans]|uniref:MBL fold metallo-hydrolase n=1 Tax=Sporomusa aerivorans TaxID=204936 RepID=UPI003529E71F